MQPANQTIPELAVPPRAVVCIRQPATFVSVTGARTTSKSPAYSTLCDVMISPFTELARVYSPVRQPTQRELFRLQHFSTKSLDLRGGFLAGEAKLGKLLGSCKPSCPACWPFRKYEQCVRACSQPCRRLGKPSPDPPLCMFVRSKVRCEAWPSMQSCNHGCSASTIARIVLAQYPSQQSGGHRAIARLSRDVVKVLHLPINDTSAQVE